MWVALASEGYGGEGCTGGGVLSRNHRQLVREFPAAPASTEMTSREGGAGARRKVSERDWWVLIQTG